MVFKFKYLGSIFASDGDHTYDVRRRIALVMARMGELRHVFGSKIKFGTKMKILHLPVRVFDISC